MIALKKKKKRKKNQVYFEGAKFGEAHPVTMEKEAQCHNTIYHHYIPHIVVEDTIPHYS